MEHTISDYDDIDRLKLEFARLRMSGCKSLFRGQADKAWSINCSLRRYLEKFSKEDLWERFLGAFVEFSTIISGKGWERFKLKHENDVFYNLSIARHLGLPCNLIDWTSSLEVAIMFACSDESIDGAVYALCGELNLNKAPIDTNPINVDKTLVACKEFDLIPDNNNLSDLPVARMRRFRQNGFFSIISKKDLIADFTQMLPGSVALQQIVIPADMKKELKVQIEERSGIGNNWLKLNDVREADLINGLKRKYFDSNTNNALQL